MTLVKCLYCDAENDALATAGYCDSCGKKLPNSAMLRTRRNLAAGPDGDEVAHASGPRRGSWGPTAEALTVAAVIHLVAAGVFLILGPLLFREVPKNYLALVLSWAILPTLLLGGAIFGSRRWARLASGFALVAGLAWVVATFAIDGEMALRWLLVQAALLPLLGRAAWIARR